MEQRQLYSSGQASEICDVSRRALRLYESKGLIVPDHISQGGYRYFTMETLRRVQVIRYFLEEGFSLDMAGRLLSTNDLDDYEEIFRNKIEETRESWSTTGIGWTPSRAGTVCSAKGGGSA